MSRTEKPILDPAEDDEMLPEHDLSKAVRGYTAYRLGEDPGDEMAVERFWRDMGFEVERVTEPALKFSKAPDFLLRRQGTTLAVCEVKSMDEFDYTIRENHADGTATETRHNWRESNLDRALHRADLASDQLSYWNGDRELANILVFVNHDPCVRREDVQGALLELMGIDATFWFEVDENGALNPKPVVIASNEGQKKLRDQLGLVIDGRLVLASSA